MANQTFHSALEKLYEAALDPEAWVAFIDEFSKIIGARGGHYFLWDQQVGGITFALPSSNYSMEIQAESAEYWNPQDTLFHRSLRRDAEWLLNNREFDKKFLAQDAYHNEFLYQNDIYHVAGYRSTSETPVSSAIGFLRGKDQKPFDDEDMKWLKHLEPHFETASRIHREVLRLRLSANMHEQAIDSLDYPILFVFENGFVAHLNQAAEDWLDQNGSINIKQNCLTGSSSHSTEILERLLHRVFEARISETLSLPHPASEKPYQIMALPLNPMSRLANTWQRPLSLIVIVDPLAKSNITLNHLQDLFGLTAAESRIAIGLAEGKTLREIADDGSVTMNTVRTQLKHTLEKTGSRRQAELINTINSFPRIKSRLNIK